jgi:hypothetical protein
MFRTLIVGLGLGRVGAGLRLPVLLRLRHEPARLITDVPLLAVDPDRAVLPDAPDLRLLPSLAVARRVLDQERAVVHICTPPRQRAELVAQIAEFGFRGLIIENPPATHAHPPAFDVAITHALGVALQLARDAEVAGADRRTLRVDGKVRPVLGFARLLPAHHGGVPARLVRERRIALRFARTTAIGHHPGSADDGYAQLRLHGPEVPSHEVVAYDAPSSYLPGAYARFRGGPLPPQAEFDAHVRAVRLLGDAKRLSGADLLTREAEPTERELSHVH